MLQKTSIMLDVHVMDPLSKQSIASGPERVIIMTFISRSIVKSYIITKKYFQNIHVQWLIKMVNTFDE